MSEHVKRLPLRDAGHPTAENGQCPICYSEGYEAAEAALRADLEKAWRLIDGAYPYIVASKYQYESRHREGPRSHWVTAVEQARKEAGR